MYFKFIIISIVFISLLSCSSYKNAGTDSNSDIQLASKWSKPSKLIPGDTVAIISPAGFLQDSIYTIQNALDTLTSWGLNYKLADHVFARKGHFAGDDSVRILDFQEAIDNPNIKAIWCTRGGYGSVRIVDSLDFSAFKINPKWVIGFSDITVIHNEMHNQGFQAIHAMMPISFKNVNLKKTAGINSLKNILFGSNNKYEITSSPYNKLGNSKGVLVGGNLSLLYAMLGSKSSINTKGKILFIEEVGESKYHLDRMLYSLKRAGYFDNCNGLIIGGMTSIKDDDSFDMEVEEIFLELLSEYNFPILFNFPAGHIVDNRALVLGAKVNLKVEKEKSTLIF